MEILDLLSKYQKVDFDKLFSDALESLYPMILFLIKKQLSEGDTVFPLGDYADKEGYASFKQKYVPTYKIYPTVDLRLTGDFYNKMFAKDSQLYIEIGSSDIKAAKLESKYGIGVYLLTEESKEQIKPVLLNRMLKAHRDAIGYS